jgi:hypothetical protein
LLSAVIGKARRRHVLLRREARVHRRGQQEDLTVLVAVFREPLEPHPENVTATLALLKGWLVDEWTPAEAKLAVGKHPRAMAVKEPPRQSPTIWSA